MQTTTTTAPPWSDVAAGATRHREQLLEYVRQWGAAHHVAGRALPSRWLAAWDIAGHPCRSRLVGCDTTATDRDRAEAAAHDLWDAAAVAWALVRWLPTARLGNAEHVVAELHASGRWLASYPLAVAAHDRAIDGLFLAEQEAPPCDR